MIFTVNPILIAAAVIPAIFLLVRVERADRLEKESRGLLLSLVVFGVVATALASLAERIGITPANLSILKNNKAKAVRFSTLEALCRELRCQPGDILEYTEEDGGYDE